MTTEIASDEKAVVERALSRIGDIATLPEVTVRIIEIVEDPKSTARDLQDVIKNDPALSAKVLKVVNSAFYGLPGQVASVDRAIVLLGLSAVKNIAIAASISRLFKGGKIAENFTARDLWKHSITVASGSRLVAKISGLTVALEEIFLAGLVHDLGILIERQAFGDQLRDVVERRLAGDGTFCEIEKSIFGADHQAFGQGLAAKWKFPRHLQAVIGYHHNAGLLSHDLQRMTAIVQAADVIACKGRFGFHLTADETTLTAELLDLAEITPRNIQEMLPQLTAEVEHTEALLGGG